MDRNSKIVLTNEYKENLKDTESLTEEDLDKQYITDEEGNRFRIPYKMVKLLTIKNVKRVGEFRDQPHVARLQYRLMEKDEILKATLNFAKSEMMITYNPKDSDNFKKKTDLDEILDFLKSQGLEIDKEKDVSEEPYDYINSFYNRAFNPPEIRDRPPYGYTPEEWKTMRAKYEEKKEKMKAEKWEKFKEWQKEYEKKHPEETNWYDEPTY